MPTYVHHENGRSGLSRAGERYAKFFRVNLEWLLTGKGPMRGQSIPVMGKVCAGAHVEYFDKSAPPENIELIDPKRLAALQVDGESMYPRFYPGEFVLFDLENVPPATLLNQYAVVQTLEGERLIKILREGRTPGLYTLEFAQSFWRSGTCNCSRPIDISALFQIPACFSRQNASAARRESAVEPSATRRR